MSTGSRRDHTRCRLVVIARSNAYDRVPRDRGAITEGSLLVACESGWETGCWAMFVLSRNSLQGRWLLTSDRGLAGQVSGTFRVRSAVPVTLGLSMWRVLFLLPYERRERLWRRRKVEGVREIVDNGSRTLMIRIPVPGSGSLSKNGEDNK